MKRRKEMKMQAESGLETKFVRLDAQTSTDGAVIEGYASLFGKADQGGDVVAPGAYTQSLEGGARVKMLWQHDPHLPIGVWDEVREDEKGLWVKGRIVTSVEKGREAAELVSAGAIDGLSIGYRTLKASKNDKGQRVLQELELWEVSLVTFPMLPSARVAAKSEEASMDQAGLRELAAALRAASLELAQR